MRSAGIPHRVVHIGPDREEVAQRLEGAPLLELGTLEPDEVSRALRTADIFLSPISDGASSRRGSLLAGLHHGLCCLTTAGDSTDRLFHDQADRGVVFARDREDFSRLTVALARDPERCRRHGQQAAVFYQENFAWESIAETCLRELGG
jgi:glycosyltransferase involved in cell wall biosynthesis